MTSLRVLDLSENSLNSSIPAMPTLLILDLSSNSLNSPVPIMPNLLELDLSQNEFKKLEDVGIWRQCHLKQLTLSENRFPMELPNTPINISECSKYAMERLYIYSSVNGRIPESLERMANLKKIDLGGNRLMGQIPASLRRLRLLEELDLSENRLTGPIPTFLGKLTKLYLSNNYLDGSIPESIGRLTSLTDLNLGGNQLTGSIPTSIGRLVFLRAFSVYSNLLNGTLPVSIGQLTKLQSLDVSNNSLGGIVSKAHFANLSMLKKLDTSSNSKLTFNVPREWMPPFQLIVLDLRHCKIAEDRFPHWLQSQRKLKVLVLSNASILGTLPKWFGMLSSIDDLDLSHNKLSGPLTNLPSTNPLFTNSLVQFGALLLQHNLFNESIPMSLCKRMDLYVINLAKNRLTGKIPNCLGDLKNLQYMIFSSNKLSGVIPSSLGHMLSLMWLNLNNNSITGKLPQELVGNLENLEIFDLGDNELSGNIPESIGKELANLLIFRLHKNNFSGRIPPSVCQMSKIQIFDVAHNILSGSIPRCLGGLYAMHGSNGTDKLLGFYDDMVIQVIKGVALEYTTTLRLVINMDLSSNKLVGKIPTEITALSGLIGLNLSNNHLSGSIPKDIGNMTALNSLDFSGNKLTGIIPPSIAALYFLSSLNLSHNNLSGRIPSGKQLQTLENPSIYAGNEDLCGAPLPKNCSSNEDPTTPPKNNYKTADKGSRKAWLYGLDIMSGFATGFWGVIGVLLFKKQWRHKFFMFAEATMDKIYVTVMVRVVKMKRGTEVA